MKTTALRGAPRAPWRIIALAAAALLLAGCTAGAPTDPSESGTAGISTEVQAAVDAAYAGTSGPLPETPTVISPDHNVWVVSAFQQISGLAKIASEVEKGADVLGWKSSVCDGQNDPNVWATCVRQATAAGADTIILAGVDCAPVAQAVTEAKEAGVVIAGISAFDCDDPTQGGSASLFDVEPSYSEDFATTADFFTRLGELRADYIISTTNGNAKVLHVAFQGVSIGDYLAKGFVDQLASCSGCEIVETVAVGPADVPNLRQMFETGLLKSAKANVIVADLDFMLALGVQPALEAAGISSDTVVLGGECTVDTIAFMRSGGGANSCIGFSNGRTAWSLLDGINRFRNGDAPAVSTIGWQLMDATNPEVWPAEGEPFEGPIDYSKGYSALWTAAG